MTYKFVNVENLNNTTENHALVLRNLYCIVDANGDVAVWDNYSVQGNRHISITTRLLPMVEREFGSASHHSPLDIKFIPLLILPDSPSRYV
jgi:hypothetical protein